MRRNILLASLVSVVLAGTARADDPRIGASARAISTPYAPSSAYLPVGTSLTSSAPPAVPPTSSGAQQVSASVPSEYGTTDGAVGRIAQLGGAPGGDSCCDGRAWLRADYLLWSVQGSALPPLVVRDASGTPRGGVGLPGTPGQQVLFGNSRLNDDMRSGFRIAAGVWFDEGSRLGIGGDVLYLGTGIDRARFGSAGDPPLSRPFFNTVTGAPDAELVAFPGVLSGSVGVSARNTFVGAGGFFQYALCCGGDPCRSYRVDAIAGYRYYGLNDDLRITENLLATGTGTVPAGTAITVNDRFRTQNTFHGGLLGLSGGVRSGFWTFDVRAALALGNMHRQVTIDGSTIVQVPGAAPVVRRGGLLAQASNIGTFSSDAFTLIPELGLNVGFRLSECVTVSAGYTFLYVPNTWRAGDQINRNIDANQIRGVANPLGSPRPTFASTGTVIQGLNVGLTFRY